MTQPAATAPDSNTGQILAVAALGLALVAVEQQVRQDVEDTIAALYKGLAAAGLITAAVMTGPAITGLALISTASWFTSTRRLFDSARLKVRDTISTGYTTASQVAYTKTRAELNEDDLPDGLPELGDNLDRLLADIDVMFGHAQADLNNTVADHFDPGNKAALAQLILDSDSSLSMRAQASAGTAVHAGANDALNALYSHYQQHTGTPGLMKRWRVTATDPCTMCAALNGTTVGVNAEFDYTAAYGDKDYRRVWRNLSGPPRHPNCRCQLELVTT